MRIELKTDFSKALQLIKQLKGVEMRRALANALNDAAYEARKTIQMEMDSSFDRVTPYIRKSVFVTLASADKLTATIEPRYLGGKGVDPQQVLEASIFGGSRKVKRSETAFRKAGILPAGFSIVPGQACPLDQYGNVKGAFIVQLITYFQAAGEQGYKANMTDKRKAKLANAGRSAGYKSINGVVYFVAYGRLRGGRTSHLAPGIWAKSGTHGSNVQPILMFVRQPNYIKRLDFFGKPVKAATDKFNPRLRYHMRLILEAKP